MKRVFALNVLLVFMFLISASVMAQDTTKDFGAQGAKIYRAGSGVALAPPSFAGSRETANGFLRSIGYGSSTINSLTFERGNSDKGYTHLRFEQEVDGLKVYGTYVKASVNSRGELVSLIENLANTSPAGVTPAKIGPREALDAVLQSYYPAFKGGFEVSGVTGNKTDFDGGYVFSDDLSVTRVAVPMAGGVLKEGFLVVTWDRDNILRHTLVGGNGGILFEELRTNTDSYNIFANHPGISAQSVVAGPGTGNAYSPIGWVASNTTIGNNVDAYLDTDNNNVPDVGGRPVDSGQNFLTVANLSEDPSTTNNKFVAVQNLFYLNNLIHDKLYRHGFNEAAGNFQANNFGNGGAGNDPVNAEAQDGGGTNNANFSTPSDGSRPRMQMYIWTQTNPNRDGDLDSDIVYHEYGHGLTWRMIGGMSGPMSGAIGEGMGDVLAILINNNDVVGEYSYDNLNGIRRARYQNYPLTYGNFSGSSVHNDGEIYAATIWRLWELWQTAGLPQNELFDYLIGGMNFTPSGPAMEDMRDGILAAAPANRDCTIWNAFAQFGIGVGAKATVKGGGPFGGRVTVTESFNVPVECGGGGGNIVLDVSLTTRGPLRANLSWTGGATSNVDIFRNSALLTTTSNTGSYTDNLKNEGSGPFTYKVCEAGSATACSNDVTVSP